MSPSSRYQTRSGLSASDARALGLSVVIHVGLLGLMGMALWQSAKENALEAAMGNALSAELVIAGDNTLHAPSAARGEPVPDSATLPSPIEDASAMQSFESAAPVSSEPPPPVQQPEPQPQPVQPQLRPRVEPKLLAKPTPQPKSVAEKPTPKPADKPVAKPAEKPAPKKVDDREARLAAIRAERAKANTSGGSTSDRLAQIRAARAAAAGGAGGDNDSTQGAGSAKSSAAGNNGTDKALEARYAAAIARKINQAWTNRPESVKSGMRCRLTISQSAGGRVTDVSVGSPCSYDEAGKASILNAVKKASPLPYAGFEDVFKERFPTTFQAQ